MPIYESVCRVCGLKHDYYQRAATCHDTPKCCGVKTEKVILTAPYGVVDIPAYQSPIDNRWINSRAQRKEDLARSGCRPWEGLEQEKKVADEYNKDVEKKEDAKLEEAVVAAWHQLPEDGRKALESSV
jgi:hypothetical protein